jgi:hypothetical protein
MNKKVIIVGSGVVGIKRGGWKGWVAERGGGWLTVNKQLFFLKDKRIKTIKDN